MASPILHLPNWARSAAGHPIELWRSPGYQKEKPLLFIGGVHGDEPEGVRLAEDLLDWLRKSHKDRLRPWILIPCLNPDGTKKNNRTNSNGVDLNRNFPTTDWSPEHKAPRYFPGPHSGSEPEVKSLVELIRSESPQLIVHFHSWEPCVVYTGAPARRAAEILSPGKEYPVSEDIGYPTPGSLGQYGWLEHQIPVICIEEQEKINLDLVWPHFASGLQQILQPETSLMSVESRNKA